MLTPQDHAQLLQELANAIEPPEEIGTVARPPNPLATRARFGGGEGVMVDTEAIDKLFLELSQFTTATTAREAELEDRLHFYKRRCEMLQSLQHTMRDPERRLVCDILANGSLLPDPNHTRYPYFNQS